MKATLKTITASLLLITFIMNDSFAQDIAKNERVVVNTNLVAASAINITDPGNTRIANKFAAMFPEAQSQQWATDSKGETVSFTNEGRKIRAGFNHNGQVNYVISNCSMNQLTPDFQNYISKNYAGYQLLNGVEVHSLGEQTQQAILQNATGYVTLNATKDGIVEIKKINKSK
jgi:hypothetical protein